MKNNSATLPKNPSANRRAAIIATVIGSAIVLIVTALFLFRGIDQRNALRRAIQSRHHSHLEQLLKDHPGLANATFSNRGPKDKWSALHLAACFSDAETIDILTRHKAKVNARDSNGLTPLHYSVSMGRYEIAETLINKGADMNAKGRDGRTPLDLAKNLRDRKLIELLRIRGAKE